MTIGRRFAAWVFLSLVLATLWGVSPMPEFLYSHFPSLPRIFYGLGVLIPIALILAALMGLFRSKKPVILIGVMAFSMLLPITSIFLTMTAGCLIPAALGLDDYCL
jgi:hypothetical protein